MTNITDAQKALDQLNKAGGPEWILLKLDPETGKALVLSKDVIRMLPYDLPGGTPITWDKCTSRTWLNTEFFDSLPEAIRGKSLEAEIVTEDNCGIPGGENTKDRVFLLSIKEYDELLPEELRPAKLDGVPCWYWLRSPGYAATDVANVMPNGVLDGGLKGHGFYSHSDCGGIRPAMVLDLS